MPEKHPNTHRWGGPGASHEDATRSMPDPGPAHPDSASSTNPRVSQRSGGGGESDEKHSHVDPIRSSKSHATDGETPSGNSREYRENRSRRDRAADARADDEEEHAAPGEDGGEDDGEAPLQVLLNSDSTVNGTERLAARVEDQVRRALRHFGGRLTRVEVFLTDENAGKAGPADKRCVLEARLRGSRPVSASHLADTLDEAVRGAAAKLGRLLDTDLGRRGRRKGEDPIREGGA